MIKKTIKYTDYEGVERTEDFYFNMTKAEVMEMVMTSKAPLDRLMTRMIAENDGAGMFNTFKDLIVRSYGKKSDDGKRFIKSKELTEEFLQTEAYSELLMELAKDGDKVAEFVNGIMPADLAKEAQKLQAEGKIKLPEMVSGN